MFLSIGTRWSVRPGFLEIAMRADDSLRNLQFTMKRHIFRLSAPTRRLYSTAPSSKQPSSPNKLGLQDLTPSQLCYYWDTIQPTTEQLAFAEKLFVPSRHSPLKLWSASKFRTSPLSSTEPEVDSVFAVNENESTTESNIISRSEAQESTV